MVVALLLAMDRIKVWLGLTVGVAGVGVAAGVGVGRVFRAGTLGRMARKNSTSKPMAKTAQRTVAALLRLRCHQESTVADSFRSEDVMNHYKSIGRPASSGVGR